MIDGTTPSFRGTFSADEASPLILDPAYDHRRGLALALEEPLAHALALARRLALALALVVRWGRGWGVEVVHRGWGLVGWWWCWFIVLDNLGNIVEEVAHLAGGTRGMLGEPCI